MKKRDLIRMPLGVENLELFDGIYSYIFSKSVTHGGFMCRIRVKDSYADDCVCVFYTNHVDSKDFDPRFDDEKDIKEKNNDWSIMSRAGGVSVHSKYVFGRIYELEFVKRGSFKKLCKIERKLKENSPVVEVS